MTTKFENFAILDKVHGFPTSQARFNKENSPPIDWKPFLSQVLSGYNNLEGSSDRFSSLSSSANRSDSGYGSSNAIKIRTVKASRWAKMSDSLLHADTKAFLKKNIRVTEPEAHHKHSPVSLTKKSFTFVDDHSDDEEEFNGMMLKSVLTEPENLTSNITKNLLLLCDSISDYVNMHQFIDFTLFNLDSIKVDLKSMFMIVEPSQLLQQVVCFVNRLNLADLSKLISQMEATVDMKDDHFEAGCADLKESINLLRNYAMSYSSNGSVESGKALSNQSHSFLASHFWKHLYSLVDPQLSDHSCLIQGETFLVQRHSLDV